jgi:hypothetical protein
MDLMRKRNASDGDSGFDSALSSRSSSISFEESPNFGQLYDESEDLYVSKLTSSDLNKKFSKILTSDEYIRHDDDINDLFVVVNQVTGVETLYKAPSSIKFDDNTTFSTTFGSEEYKRGSPIPRTQLFNSRLEYELEKPVAKMTLVEVDLIVDSNASPPSNLGIRVVGVNMIHGVQDKLNIYIKKVVDDSLAGADGRIKIDDLIVEVNGISLVGVSQRFAAQTLSKCAISPETGTVHFVLARQDEIEENQEEEEDCNKKKIICDETEAVVKHKLKNNIDDNISTTKSEAVMPSAESQKIFTDTISTFGSGDAIRLRSSRVKQLHDNLVEMSRFSKQLVIFGTVVLVSVFLSTCN